MPTHAVCSVEIALLAVSLVCSALLLSVTWTVPGHTWLSWFCLFPLFVAIRVLRPREAGVAGILWGASLELFLLAGGQLPHMQGIEGGFADTGGFVSAVALTGLAGLYTWTASWLSRRVGFSPFLLGVGWMLFELALAPLGLPDGLLGRTGPGGQFVQFVAQGLGYVFVAFLAAYVSALLVESVGAMATVPSVPRFACCEEQNIVAFHRTGPVAAIRELLPRTVAPRAPPLAVVHVQRKTPLCGTSLPEWKDENISVSRRFYGYA